MDNFPLFMSMKIYLLMFRLWLVAWPAPSLYLNRCRNIVNWTLVNFNGILIKIQQFSLKKMRLEIMLAKCRPSFVGLSELTHISMDLNDTLTVTSLWVQWRLKLPASWLFTQPFVQAQIKENTKAPRHWPLCGEFAEDRWIPHTKGQ